MFLQRVSLESAVLNADSICKTLSYSVVVFIFMRVDLIALIYAARLIQFTPERPGFRIKLFNHALLPRLKFQFG